jgi:hypothetical protein
MVCRLAMECRLVMESRLVVKCRLTAITSGDGHWRRLDEAKKIVSMAMPLLRASGQCRKIILTPISRHRDSPCCGAKDHRTKNRPNWVKGSISEAVRRSDGVQQRPPFGFCYLQLCR